MSIPVKYDPHLKYSGNDASTDGADSGVTVAAISSDMAPRKYRPDAVNASYTTK